MSYLTGKQLSIKGTSANPTKKKCHSPYLYQNLAYFLLPASSLSCSTVFHHLLLGLNLHLIPSQRPPLLFPQNLLEIPSLHLESKKSLHQQRRSLEMRFEQLLECEITERDRIPRANPPPPFYRSMIDARPSWK